MTNVATTNGLDTMMIVVTGGLYPIWVVVGLRLETSAWRPGWSTAVTFALLGIYIYMYTDTLDWKEQLCPPWLRGVVSLRWLVACETNRLRHP